MSLYNMLFGMNSHSDLLLAVIGLRKHDVERFRDVHASSDGRRISVYSRTGGGNRSDYPQVLMRHLPGWVNSEDDDFDSTYCNDHFETPQEFVEDVRNLDNILTFGMRPEFAQRIATTLCREPTDADKEATAYAKERSSLQSTKHFMANGHTFVPMDDYSMLKALEIAESNGGSLRTCWGILPISLTVKTDFYNHPNARSEEDRQYMTRVEVNYDYGWKIDLKYWEHCKQRWSARFPLTMAKIEEDVQRHSGKAARSA